MTPDQLAKSDTEAAHQRAFFAWCNSVGIIDAFAIPNGGSRGDDAKARAIRGAALLAEGVKPGVYDVMLARPVMRPIMYAGLWIEFKRPGRERERNGGMSAEQVAWGELMRLNGYATVTVYSWREAATAVARYLGIDYEL